MGGKQKQSQRTKGNVKASSSARAAEFLESVGGAQGFGALGGDLGYVPVNQSLEDADSSVDSEFRMLMRKLTKRDTTTKIKALQEIASLCQEKEKVDVKTVLPFWPRLYGKLSIDHERRVREATQQTMKELVSCLGREIAPQLKALMGPWLVAQCDPYGPAANMAKAAFSAVFSPAKQQDTLVFCKNEIMNHVEDNILNQTAETLSDKKITEVEDMQNKYERTVACSLSAWKTFLLTVPPQQDLVETYNKIMKQPSFWKLHNHQAELIRGSFYSLLSALCQIHPAIITDGYAEKACTSTLYKLDDTSPVVCPSLWEATLQVVSIVQNWFEKINPKKGFLPKLWKMLREGGEGSAVVIYPNLLPLLSKMPVDVISGKDSNFVDVFFETIKKSLGTDKVLQSQQNIDVIVSSFMECMRYCVKQNCHAEGEPICTMLVEKFNQVVMASVSEENQRLATSPLYEEATKLVAYAAKISENCEEGSDKLNTINNVEKLIWVILREVCIHHLEDDALQNREYVTDRLNTLLSRLQQLESSDVLASSNITKLGGISNKTAGTEMRSKPLFALISEVSILCYQRMVNRKCELLLKLFCNMLEIYSYDAVLLNFLEKTKGYNIDKDKGHVREDFLEQILMPAFEMEFESTEATVQILLSVMVNLIVTSEREKVPVFLSKVLKQIEVKTDRVVKLTSEILQSKNPEALSWLQGDDYGSAIVKVTHLMCVNVWGGHTDLSQETELGSQAIDTCVGLLTLVISAGPESCSVLGSKYIEGVVEELQYLMPSQSLLEASSYEDIVKCVEFVCTLATKIFPALKDRMFSPSAEALHLALFQLNTDSLFKPDMCAKLTLAWQKGTECLYNIDKKSLPKFFLQAAFCLQENLIETEKRSRLSFDRIENLCELTVKLISCIPEVDHKQTLIKELELAFEVCGFWKACSLLKEALLLPDESKQVKEYASKPDLILTKPTKNDTFEVTVLGGIFSSTQAYMGVLSSLYFNCQLAEQVPRESKYAESTLTKLECNVCLGLALCEIYDITKQCTNNQNAKDIQCIKQYLEETFRKNMDVPGRKLMMTKHFIEMSFSEGELWSEGLSLLIKRCKGAFTFEQLNDVMDSIDSLCNVSDLKAGYTVLLLLDLLPPSELINFASVLVATVMSLPTENIEQVKGYYLQLALLTKTLSCLVMLESSESTKDLIGDIVGLVSVLQEWQEKYEDLFNGHVQMLFYHDAWNLTRFNIQVMRFLSCVVTHASHQLTKKHWDFVLCKLIWWLQEMPENAQLVHIHLFQLLTAVCQCMNQVSTAEPERKSLYPPELYTEWMEFFNPQALKVAVTRFINCVGSNPSILHLASYFTTIPSVMNSVCEAALFCSKEHLLEMDLPVKLVALKPMGYPENLETALNYLCPMLLKERSTMQQTAFKLVRKLIGDIQDEEEKRSVSEDEESRHPPHALWEVVDVCKEALLLWLKGADIKIGSKWRPEEGSEELTAAMAYLLGWMLILDLFKTASPTIRASYAAYLRDSESTDALMYVLFCVMPSYPVVTTEGSDSAVGSPSGKMSGKSLFEIPLRTELKDSWTQRDLGHYACAVYFMALEELPALVRQWCNKQDRRVADIVDKFTSKFVSPFLCDKQISDVKQEAFVGSNLKVVTRQVTREVIATYSVDEASIELVVTLPANHPLGAVRVEQGRKTGIGLSEWRNWMLQLTTFLQHQNGSIAKGLELWKRNVDKKFEGVEECYVCYSVIHGTTCQLPRLQCKTCKKKFHSSCLYKWFSTSNNSTCPLCRNLF